MSGMEESGGGWSGTEGFGPPQERGWSKTTPDHPQVNHRALETTALGVGWTRRPAGEVPGSVSSAPGDRPMANAQPA
jgi:hypothetical protein